MNDQIQRQDNSGDDAQTTTGLSLVPITVQEEEDHYGGEAPPVKSFEAREGEPLTSTVEVGGDEPMPMPRPLQPVTLRWATIPNRMALPRVYYYGIANTQLFQDGGPHKDDLELALTSWAAPVSTKKDLWPLRVMVYAGGVLTNIMMACLGPFFAEYAEEKYGVTPTTTGMIFASFPALSILASPIAAWLCQKMGYIHTHFLGLLVACISTIGFGLSKSVGK